MDYKKEVSNYLANEINTIAGLDVGAINELVKLLNDCLLNERKIYVFGNGGSGSTASHMTSDFNKAIFNGTDKTFNFECLNDNVALVLAIANDEAYEEIFRYQLKKHLTSRDVVIGISGSGNSKNIINAINYAKEIGAIVVGFTGYDGGMLKKIADISLNTNINNMQITEDIHLMIEHLMISIFNDKYGKREYKKKMKVLDE